MPCLCQLYLGAGDKSRDAAAYLLSKFLTRPDVKREFLPQMIDWNLKMICMSDGRKFALIESFCYVGHSS